jgi:hypothetical protein
VNKDRDADLEALLRAVVDEDAPPPPPTSAFAQQVGAALGQAVAAMRKDGIIEVSDGSVDPLVAEVTEAGLDARSPKHLVRKVIRTMLESEYVDEVYGSDDVISASLHRFLDPT